MKLLCAQRNARPAIAAHACNCVHAYYLLPKANHPLLAGKTTFIKYLLGGRDYPGINIGPEPTTDRFVVVEHGLEERRTPGNTLVVQPSKPYQARPWSSRCFVCPELGSDHSAHSAQSQ